ncbi:MAG: phosphoribosylformylglycinamidine cyclo-ligase, partial [bacterium]|nr:phosphoribosylformylglycinamidine cyclo-ligase [bacterium]
MAKKTTYREAGVSVAANSAWVSRIQSALSGTHDSRVCSIPGAFAGLMRLDFDRGQHRRDYRRPVLVGCADGVGTKVLLGIQAKRLRGLGVDLVAMNVNDLITCGAEPLFFLDYLAVHKLDPAGLTELIGGVADGCRESGCALLGGETAEMPDLYRRGHFDLAGFATGVVEERRIIDGRRVSPGDILIGLASSGIHSNGFTLVRKLLKDRGLKLGRGTFGGGGCAILAETLLAPTRIYVNAVRRVLDRYRVKQPVTGMAHITGGGLRENVARMLPTGCTAEVDRRSWTPPPVFPFLQSLGVTRAEMFR